MDGPQPQICREQIWTHKVRPEGEGKGHGRPAANQPPTRGFSVNIFHDPA